MGQAQGLLITVVDTSVLLNFALTHQFSLLTSYLRHRALVTSEVYEEVKRPPGRQALQNALERGDFGLYRLWTLKELELFGRILGEGTLGAGEAETIAAGVVNGWDVLIDERVATEIALRELGGLRVWDTHRLLTDMVENRALSDDQARLLVESMRNAGRRLPPWR